MGNNVSLYCKSILNFCDAFFSAIDGSIYLPKQMKSDVCNSYKIQSPLNIVHANFNSVIRFSTIDERVQTLIITASWLRVKQKIKHNLHTNAT